MELSNQSYPNLGKGWFAPAFFALFCVFSRSKFFCGCLVATNAGDYLISDISVHEADSLYILDGDGVPLAASFLSGVAADSGKGVILIEGIKETTSPLVLEVVSNNTVLCQSVLSLSISGVEKMFYHKNLRPDPSLDDRTDAPNEITSNGKNFVFVHGYNVSEKAARGWHSTMFKRMFWSGSNAKFHGITWRGNQSQIRIPILGNKVTPDYHVNVINALNAAQGLKNYAADLSGTTVIAAHSLGNVLAGSAIKFQPTIADKWFMIDGAVAIEAFDGGSGVQNTNMIHPDWIEYNDRLWATEWHELFNPTNDYRGRMTWRGFFGTLLSKTYNFYSLGEEVLETHKGNPAPIDYVWGSRAWCLQEKRKGRNWATSIGGSTMGGWGFNGEYNSDNYKGTNHVLLADAELIAEPFFRPGNGYLQNLYDHHNGSAFAAQEMNTFLAGFVPARTLPCGANSVGALQGPPNRNFNMNAMPVSWPQERLNDPEKGNRWLHSDIREIAYPYVHEVFKDFVTEGGLE